MRDNLRAMRAQKSALSTPRHLEIKYARNGEIMTLSYMYSEVNAGSSSVRFVHSFYKVFHNCCQLLICDIKSLQPSSGSDTLYYRFWYHPTVSDTKVLQDYITFHWRNYGVGRHVFLTPLGLFRPPSSPGCTDHSFGNNLKTYNELYLMHTHCMQSKNMCRPPLEILQLRPCNSYSIGRREVI